jgi:streptogramin lyase
MKMSRTARLALLAVSALSVATMSGTAALAADNAKEDTIRIVRASPTEPIGAGADLVFGPGDRVWGFDGAYGCGSKVRTPERDAFGVTCNLFSVKLDGSDYRRYPVPPEIVHRPVPGEPPSAADLAKYPKWFAAFFYKPYCGCDAEPPTPGRPSGNAYNDLTVGSDGNLWFTAMGEGGVWLGKMTPSGAFTVLPMPDILKAAHREDKLTQPTRPSWGGFPIAPSPWDIETGPDGRIYFSVYDGWAATQKLAGPADRSRQSWIGSFDPKDPLGTLKTWGIPGLGAALQFGPDGQLWFMSQNHYYSNDVQAVIGRLDIRTGGVTTWRLPQPTDFKFGARDACCVSWTSNYIQFDPKGRLWYTLEFMAGIGRFDLSNGSFTWFSEGHEVEGGFGSSVIALGNDGLLYKVVTPIGDVLQIDLDGRVLKYIKNPRPSASLALRKMPDGTLWMTDHLRANLQKVVGIPDNLRDKH